MHSLRWWAVTLIVFDFTSFMELLRLYECDILPAVSISINSPFARQVIVEERYVLVVKKTVVFGRG